MSMSHRRNSVLLTLLFVLIFPTLSLKPIKAQDNTLIDSISSLLDKVNWNENYAWWTDVAVRFAGYCFGEVSKTEIDDWLQTSTELFVVSLGYTIGDKFGIENEIKIKWFLDNQGILTNGLPQFWNSSYNYFRTADRFLLSGYYWAERYDYALGKWNVTKAYDNFKWAIDNAPVPAALYVYSNNSTYCGWGDTEPRFYDECSETIDCFLYFYQLGITEALDEALETWDYVNNILWTGSYYKYRPSASDYECEAGGFLQIALKLKYYSPNIENISRVTDDMVKRYLSERWLSPQWSNGGTPYYAVVHAHPSNYERRLANTLVSWCSLFGNYYALTMPQKVNMASLLTGYAGYDPAWKLLFNSTAGLYDSASGLFREYDTACPADRTQSSASAAILLVYLGIIPETGCLAIPISEICYEDQFSLFDKDLFALNIDSRMLRIAIQKAGTIKFQYGSSLCTYNFTQRGVYEITFASDWNALSNTIRIGDLPANRIYFTETLKINTQTSKPSYQASESIEIYGNLTYDGSPVPEKSVALEVVDPSNDPVVAKILHTDTCGAYGTTFKLPFYAELGTYTVYVSASYNGDTVTSSITFQLIPLSSIDIAVTNLTRSKSLVGRGYVVNITTTVENQGYLTESFNVSVFCDETAITLPDGKNYVTITLTGGNSAVLIFIWNTTGFAYGNYTIKTVVDPLADEIDTEDNNYTYLTSVHVGVPGDVSSIAQGVFDGKVNMRDVNYITLRFYTEPDSPSWDPNSDINNDSKINMRDVTIAMLNFSKTELN